MADKADVLVIGVPKKLHRRRAQARPSTCTSWPKAKDAEAVARRGRAARPRDAAVTWRARAA